MKPTTVAVALTLLLLVTAGCSLDKNGALPSAAPSENGVENGSTAPGADTGRTGNETGIGGETADQTSVAREQEAAAAPLVPAFPESQSQQRVVGLQPVHFEFDSSGLSAGARKVLEANAAWLRRHPNVKVRVEGHCDERGTSAYNLGLGLRRSHQVRDYLRALGLAGDRLHPVTLGEEFPLKRGHDEAAYRLNRRVEFALVDETALLER